MNSPTLVTSALPAVCFLIQYSRALTSWLVTASISLDLLGLAGPKSAPGRRVRRRWQARRRGFRQKWGSAARALEPPDFDLQTTADEAQFGKLGPQGASTLAA